MIRANKLKGFILIISTLAIAAASFFLPQLILSMQDNQLFGGAQMVEVEEIGLSLVSNLSKLDKLRFAGEYSASTIELETGRYMDSDDADLCFRYIISGMGYYTELWDIEVEDPNGLLTLESSSVALNIDSNGSSMVVWTLDYTFDGGTVEVDLDDETGLLLGGRCVFDNTKELEEWGYDLYSMDITEFVYSLADVYYMNQDLGYFDVFFADENSGIITVTDGVYSYELRIRFVGSAIILN